MTQAHTAHAGLMQLAEEIQVAEGHCAGAAAIQQMQRQRDGRCCQPDQGQGVEKLQAGVLAFCLAGGGVSLFLFLDGSNDIVGRTGLDQLLLEAVVLQHTRDTGQRFDVRARNVRR